MSGADKNKNFFFKSINLHLAIFWIPALPGEQNNLSHFLDFFIAQQMECSRAPLPKTKIFKKKILYYDITLINEKWF